MCIANKANIVTRNVAVKISIVSFIYVDFISVRVLVLRKNVCYCECVEYENNNIQLSIFL